MSNKDKKILALVSGGFLAVLALVLFVTMQARDNLISNTGRTKGVQVGDTFTSCGDNWYIVSGMSGKMQSCPGAYSKALAESNNDNWYRECTTISTSSVCMEFGLDAPCYDVKEYGRTCDEVQLATLNCSDATWDGTSKTLATCTGCDLVQGGTGTAKDQYTITAQAQDGYLFEGGSNTATCTATISCRANTTWNGTICESNVTSNCSAGFRPDGRGGCEVCPKGTYSKDGDIECTLCPNGYTTSGDATTSVDQCNVCPNGNYIDVNDGSKCKICPAGFSCNGTAIKDDCANHGTNYYSLEGATECSQCPNGDANSAHTGCITPTPTATPTAATPTPTSTITGTCCIIRYGVQSSVQVFRRSDCEEMVGTNGITSAEYIGGDTTCPTVTSTPTPTATTDCSDSGVYLQDGTCHTCEKGWYCPENDNYRYDCGMPKKTTAGTGSTSEDDCICADGYHLMSDGITCEQDAAFATLTCHTKTYDGTDQIIASCNNCTITNDSYAVNGGKTAVATGNQLSNTEYAISATANNGYTFSNESTSASCTANILRQGGTSVDCCYLENGTYKYGSVANASSCANDDNETQCLARNKKKCCYKTFSGYAWGETQENNCDHDSLSIDNQQDCLAQNNKCNISVSTTSTAVSIDEDLTSSNSYYTVNVSVSGYGCRGEILYSATNYKNISPTSETISSSTYAGSSTYSFNVYPDKACQISTAYATVIDGSFIVTTSNVVEISVNGVKNDWHDKDVCERSPSVPYRSAQEADAAGADVYYSDYKQCTLNGTTTFGYTKKWERSGCGGGGSVTPVEEYCYCDIGTHNNCEYYKTNNVPSGKEKVDSKYCTTPTSTPKPTTTSTPKPTTSPTNYCWMKPGSNGVGNQYITQSTSPGTGWVKVGKVGEVTCGETEACYKVENPNSPGQYLYVKGSYSGIDGYEYIGVNCPAVSTSTPDPSNPSVTPDPSNPSITPDPSNPVVATEYCWIKRGTNGEQNDYAIGTVAPNSDWEIYGIAGMVTCGRTDACYKSDDDGSYVIGDYDGVTGFSKYGATCPVEACYYNPKTGNYNWTDSPLYSDVLISSIDDPDDCKAPSVDPVVNYVCYVNGTNDKYKWRKECASDEYYNGTSCVAGTNPSTAPKDIYTIDSSIDGPMKCTAAETPACYENLTTGSHDWGTYKSNIGYSYVSGDKNDCIAACYRNTKTGRLIWGYYSKNSNYSIESSISEDDCKEIIADVPKTSASISTIIYVAMAIFGIVGFGFIIYSNYNKPKVDE